METKKYDVVIVGGGVMGCSTAYYLMKSDNTLKVVVVEMDPAYERASSTLSVSNARIQFSLKENIQVSRYALEKLECFEEEMTVDDLTPRITYRPEGNLFLVEEKARASAESAMALQKELGGQVEWLSPEEIKRRHPLYEPSDVVGGTFGPRDGHFDAYAVLMGYRKKARSLGADFLEGEVVELLSEKGRMQGVRLASEERLDAPLVVNCAGAWCAGVAKTAGVELPVDPVKRQIFIADPAVKPDEPLPLTVLPSGLYFRTETGGLLIIGKSMEEDPKGFNFSWDEKRFMEILWPELAEFVPVFDTLKLMRGWAGLYAVNSLDGNAILGEWPEMKGLFLANGFSGHGLQQAPAVGRYMSELLTGRTPTLDLSIFSPERIIEKKPVGEGGLV